MDIFDLIDSTIKKVKSDSIDTIDFPKWYTDIDEHDMSVARNQAFENQRLEHIKQLEKEEFEINNMLKQCTLNYSPTKNNKSKKVKYNLLGKLFRKHKIFYINN